jgi:hypothetical protein
MRSPHHDRIEELMKRLAAALILSGCACFSAASAAAADC